MIDLQNLKNHKETALRKLSFFQYFSEAAMQDVFQIAKWQNYEGNQLIVHEGERGDDFFVIVEGEVKIARNHKTLNILLPGDCFGEMVYLQSLETMVNEFPLFDQYFVRSADVVTLVPVTTVSISTQDLSHSSIECQHSFDRRFLSVLLERLMHANTRLSS